MLTMLVVTITIVVTQHSILEIKNKATFTITDNGAPHLYEDKGLGLGIGIGILGLGLELGI